MCNLTITDSLAAKIQPHDIVEQRMEAFAHDAKVGKAGILDAPNTHLRSGFAPDLRQAGVRKKRVGRHRVYFTGVHTDCNYTAFYVKKNKKEDNSAQDDNTPTFHALVRNALNAESRAPRILPDPDGPSRAESVLDYQEADWFKEQQKFLTEAIASAEEKEKD